MNEILQANIFFFIASIATVCFCIMVCIILYHVIKITQSVRLILDRMEEGSEILAEDLASLRRGILEGGIFSRIIGLFFGGATESATPKRKRKFTSRNSKSYGSKETSSEEDSAL